MAPMLQGRGIWIAATQGGPEVSARLDGRVNTLLSQGCYCGFSLESDGDEYEYSSTGNLASLTTWLDSGSGGQVWVTWNRTGGSLSDWNNIGAGNDGVRLQLSSNRNFRQFRSATGINTIIGYCQFHDAASGGNLLQQTGSATWSAENEFDPCPICCFTPETPIMMESGIQMPIGKIRKGDRILVWNPRLDPHEAQYGEEVTGIIDRVNRTMYRVTFEDGRHLDMSEDHPLHIEDKGPHSIYPTVEYKDVGLPEVLKVGDHASRILLGTHSVVKSIEPIPYRGVVYTLENSLFYANGILVY